MHVLYMTGKAKKRVAPVWERLSFCLFWDVDLEVREDEMRDWKEGMKREGGVLRTEGVYRPGGSIGME